ncbi:MAG: hypothetical protein Q7S57_02305 [bacterium]|nr:hypothetical protein [bacterium]
MQSTHTYSRRVALWSLSLYAPKQCANQAEMVRKRMFEQWDIAHEHSDPLLFQSEGCNVSFTVSPLVKPYLEIRDDGVLVIHGVYQGGYERVLCECRVNSDQSTLVRNMVLDPPKDDFTIYASDADGWTYSLHCMQPHRHRDYRQM